MDADVLKSVSMKATKKRIMILESVRTSPSPVTAEDIYEKLSQSLDISLSTVYRALNAMSDKGIIIKAVRQDGKTYFHFNDHQHKHELICSVCHRSVDVEDCPFDEISRKIAQKTGFVITGHNMEFTGICPNCAGKTDRRECD
mgnify:FL=1